MILIRVIWIIEFLYLLTKTSNIDDCDEVLWIPRIDIYYPFRTAFVWDLEFVKQLLSENKRVAVQAGLKSIGNIKGKKVYYNPQYNMNIFNVAYENCVYPIISEILEQNNNVVSPGRNDISLWENKKEMYSRFAYQGISHPETKIMVSLEEIKAFENKEKYIIKPAFSKSSIGIKVAKDHEDMIETLLTDSVLILQKIEEISRDSRVIVIGGRIVLQYWRNKIDNSNNEDFVTTATGNGSKVTFNEFSPELESFVLDSTEKMGLLTAAWDVIEINGELKALEVSPVYYPNSNRGYDEKIPYRDYKNRWLYQFDMRFEFGKHVKARLLCTSS